MMRVHTAARIAGTASMQVIKFANMLGVRDVAGRPVRSASSMLAMSPIEWEVFMIQVISHEHEPDGQVRELAPRPGSSDTPIRYFSACYCGMPIYKHADHWHTRLELVHS